MTSIWREPTNRTDALMCARPLGLHDAPYTEVSSHFRFRADRKSTRLNSSHTVISYAVFCLKKKKHHRDKGGPLIRIDLLESCEQSVRHRPRHEEVARDARKQLPTRRQRRRRRDRLPQTPAP